MKLKRLILLPIMCLLTACGAKEKDTGYYAYFMNNYPRVIDVAPSGNEMKMDNTLYKKINIKPGVPFAKPEDPTRDNYQFAGWFKEKACNNPWDFANDSSLETIFLYAKWELTGSEQQMEPEYVYPEKIIDDANYRVTGILNSPVANNEVNLATGAINRLTAHKEDVSFAVNYERRATVNLTVATYDTSSKNIHLEVSSGETFDIKVNDISGTLSIASESSTYEAKAQKYETLGTDYENYHIALAGSSSMENWSTSTIDMSPVVTFNHGIGGTTVEQWTNKLFERLVLPYSSKAVVYYVGVNNIINGNHDSGRVTGQYLTALFNKTHEYLPNTKIFYVLINRLPGFGNYQNEFDIANNMAIAYSQKYPYLECLDAGKGLLKEDGTPNSAYFLSDGLHMSKYGYVIWGGAVKEAILKWLNSK